MRPVRLRIDHLAVEIGDDERVADAEATVRTALAMLATRLAAAPLGDGRHALRRALELVELDPGWTDRLAGPAAAAQLADELYRRIAGGTR